MIFQELFAVRLIINIRRHNQRLLVVQEALSVELKGLLLIYAPGVFGSFCTARRPGSSANSEPIRMKAIPSPKMCIRDRLNSLTILEQFMLDGTAVPALVLLTAKM